MLAKTATRVAVFCQIPAKTLTPPCLYHLMNQATQQEGVMFEKLGESENSRYSFLCFDKKATFKIDTLNTNQPIAELRSFLNDYKFVTRKLISPLITHSFGFVCYESTQFFENVANQHTASNAYPFIYFNSYALSLTYDHEHSTILISVIVDVSDDIEGDYQSAFTKLTEIQKILSGSVNQENKLKSSKPKDITVDVSDNEFVAQVEKAKHYISQGDIFQVVLSRSFMREYTVCPFDIYKKSREVTPAPYSFYFPTEYGVFVGASPERFMGCINDVLSFNPIAGTRKRTKQNSDKEIESDLLSDKKEIAEHMMLVDLARNDLGIVSEVNSVNVSELMKVKHYSHVSHITSTVIGKLKNDIDPLTAFFTAFPAGTLSGAPKIRAMQIINELEQAPRGIYGGAICRIDASDNIDSCIAIRMAELNNGIARVRAGAGIVYDSIALNEANETRQKAQSMLEVISKAEGEKK